MSLYSYILLIFFYGCPYILPGDLKSKIDKLWEEFWAGGITNPLTVIEQITYLMYSRMLDMLDMQESKDEQRKALAGVEFKPRFSKHEQDYRFSHFANLGADEMMELVRDEVFRHFRSLSHNNGETGSLLGSFMKDAGWKSSNPACWLKPWR